MFRVLVFGNAACCVKCILHLLSCVLTVLTAAESIISLCTFSNSLTAAHNGTAYNSVCVWCVCLSVSVCQQVISTCMLLCRSVLTQPHTDHLAGCNCYRGTSLTSSSSQHPTTALMSMVAALRSGAAYVWRLYRQSQMRLVPIRSASGMTVPSWSYTMCTPCINITFSDDVFLYGSLLSTSAVMQVDIPGAMHALTSYSQLCSLVWQAALELSCHLCSVIPCALHALT